MSVFHPTVPRAHSAGDVQHSAEAAAAQYRLRSDRGFWLNGAISLGTKIIKEHEERMFQEAVIKTIGGPREGVGPGEGGRARPAVEGVDGRSRSPRMLVPGFVGLCPLNIALGLPW